MTGTTRRISSSSPTGREPGRVVVLNEITGDERTREDILNTRIRVEVKRGGESGQVGVAYQPIELGRRHTGSVIVTLGAGVPVTEVGARVRQALASSDLSEVVQTAKAAEAEAHATQLAGRRVVVRLLEAVSDLGVSPEDQARLQEMVRAARGQHDSDDAARAGQRALNDWFTAEGLSSVYYRSHREAVAETMRQVAPELTRAMVSADARRPLVVAEPAIADRAAVGALTDLMQDVAHPRTFLLEEQAMLGSPGWLILYQEALEQTRRRHWARTGQWLTLDETAQQSALKVALQVRPPRATAHHREHSGAYAQLIILWSGEQNLSQPRSASFAQVEKFLDEQTPLFQHLLQQHNLSHVQVERFSDVHNEAGTVEIILRAVADDEAQAARAAALLLEQTEIAHLSATASVPA